MKKFATMAAAACFCAAAAPLVQADPLDDAIKARRAYYQLVLFNAGPVLGMARDKVPYDAQRATTSAQNLQALASMKNAAMWPKGSDNEAKKGATRALPAIWDKPGIADKGKAFREAIAELAKVAGNGLDAMKPKATALGATCAACHKEYRAKDF